MNGLQELDGWEGEKEVEQDSVGLYEAREGERERVGCALLLRNQLVPEDTKTRDAICLAFL